MGDFMKSKLSISLLLLILSSCATATSNISSQFSSNDVIDSSNHSTSLSSSSLESTITSSITSTTSVNDSSNPSTSSNSSTSTTSSTSSITGDLLPEVEIDDQTGKFNFQLDIGNAEALAIIPLSQLPINQVNRGRLKLASNNPDNNVLVKKTESGEFELINSLFNDGQSDFFNFNIGYIESKGLFTYAIYINQSESNSFFANKNLEITTGNYWVADTFLKRLSPTFKTPTYSAGNNFKALIINNETGDIFDFDTLVFDALGNNEVLVRMNRYNSSFFTLVQEGYSPNQKTVIKRFTFEENSGIIRVDRFTFPIVFVHYYLSEKGDIVYRLSLTGGNPFVAYNLFTGTEKVLSFFETNVPQYFINYNGIIYGKRSLAPLVYRFDEDFNPLPNLCLDITCIDGTYFNSSNNQSYVTLGYIDNLWIRAGNNAFEIINFETGFMQSFPNEINLGSVSQTINFTWGNFVYFIVNKMIFSFNFPTKNFLKIAENIYSTNFVNNNQSDIYTSQTIKYSITVGLGLIEYVIDINTGIVYQTGETRPSYDFYFVTPMASPSVVINLISSLGTPPSLEKVFEARRLFNLLTSENKAKVTNYQALLDAESFLRAFYVDELILEINLLNLETFIKTTFFLSQLTNYELTLLLNYSIYLDNQIALNVITAINDLLELDSNDEGFSAQIIQVREMYDALTEDQKLLVYNVEFLESLENQEPNVS